MPRLIDLTQNRTLAIRQGGRRYSITVAPIPQPVWVETFFDAIEATVKCGDGRAEKHVDVRSAAVELVERVATAAEGYPGLANQSGWQSKLPLAHRLTYGEMLIEAYEPQGAGSEISSPDGTHSVRLQALWSAGPTGAMCMHRHLGHKFKVPSGQQKEQLRRANAGIWRSAGWSRRGTPVFLASLSSEADHVLAALYDQLILSVEGYSQGGQPLHGDRAEIARSMDAFHKVTAARSLFSRSGAKSEHRRVA